MFVDLLRQIPGIGKILFQNNLGPVTWPMNGLGISQQ